MKLSKNTLAVFSVLGLSMAMISVSHAAAPSGFKKFKTTDGGMVTHYRGEVTVKGTLDVSAPDDEYTPCYLCFYVDKTDYKKIPRVGGDDRTPWFAFDNSRYNEANKSYEILGKKFRSDKCYAPIKTTVRIKNYKVDRADTETVDTTTAVRIIAMDTPKVIACESN